MPRPSPTSQLKAVRTGRRLLACLDADRPEARALEDALGRAVDAPWRPFAPLPADLRRALAAAWSVRHERADARPPLAAA